jgi:hypothetical protein
VSAVRSKLSRSVARLLCERYGVRPKGDVVESPVDERFGQAFAWGIPAEAAPVVDDQAELHIRELAAELAAFDHYKPSQNKPGQEVTR